ncbi:arf-GAP with coiled-coil, ANK repeat and PH domain-containing protein 2 isoform X1 [Tachysurus fulvidraco]|uniref:arf-GAP with coiled-coil, ANK repeat and PH domain-containing protein 2 isoform X1 n=1 Tax=Tachysurus fulvidraco TaxID=1234273 RepID=UPI000F4D2E03|nr:arf-GAP with coiled-coil, ANK repeat and PH domain-containing protein 2 isoform X1 [Tachysurus fulvidraco]
MIMKVDFEECLKDSPRFRAAVEDVEGDVGELESKLDKLVKLSIGMIDAGRVYSHANRQFINGIRDLALQSSRDDVIGSSLAAFAETLQEMNNYHTILFDQAQRSVRSQLQTFVKEDLRKFKEVKKQFDKASEEKEVALVKNAQVPRNKPHEVDEAANILTTTRKCFRHIALDYVLQINVLQSKKRLEILKSMLSFMNSNLSFFQQGYTLFSDLEPLMKQLGGQLDQLVVDSAKEKRDMEQKHSAIQQQAALQDLSSEDCGQQVSVDCEDGVMMEGYLFKRASNAFKTWNSFTITLFLFTVCFFLLFVHPVLVLLKSARRWFSIQRNQLVYQKRFRDNLTVVVEDLRLCTIKQCEDVERRFCFEVVSPNKSCILQADSEKLRQFWTKAVQNSIATAYRENGEEPVTRLQRESSASLGSLDSLGECRSGRTDTPLHRLLSVRGNQNCCDCGEAEPRWASINLGITLCIACSGIHRSLGVHNSKVRSLTLDSWEPELLKLMCELGNELINHIYEARRGEIGWKKPQPGDSRQEIEAYIRAKYVERRFVRKQDSREQRSKVMVLSKHDKHLKGSTEFLPPRPPPPTPKIRPASNTSAPLIGQEARRDSLFCPDELDSLFSYFDTSSKLRSYTVKSADSGIHTSADGSREMLNSSSNTSLSEPDLQETEPPREPPPILPCVTECSPNLLLYWASCASSLADMVEALALGADVNWANTEDQSRTPLMQAVQGGSLLPCEFLLQNSSNVDQQDARGRGALHHAAMLGHTGQVCLFLKRGACQSVSDMDGRSPLSIAMDTTNADIVTLLRMAKVNEEMRESLDQPTQYFQTHSHSEQYRKCIQEFISQQLDEC